MNNLVRFIKGELDFVTREDFLGFYKEGIKDYFVENVTRYESEFVDIQKVPIIDTNNKLVKDVLIYAKPSNNNERCFIADRENLHFFFIIDKNRKEIIINHYEIGNILTNRYIYDKYKIKSLFVEYVGEYRVVDQVDVLKSFYKTFDEVQNRLIEENIDNIIKTGEEISAKYSVNRVYDDVNKGFLRDEMDKLEKEKMTFLFKEKNSLLYRLNNKSMSYLFILNRINKKEVEEIIEKEFYKAFNKKDNYMYSEFLYTYFYNKKQEELIKNLETDEKMKIYKDIYKAIHSGGKTITINGSIKAEPYVYFINQDIRVRVVNSHTLNFSEIRTITFSRKELFNINNYK